MHKLTMLLICFLILIFGLEISLALAANMAISLDGYGDYVSVPHNSIFNFSNKLSLEAWVYYCGTRYGDHDGIITKTNPSFTWGTGWALRRTMEFRIRTSDTPSTGRGHEPVGVELDINQWNHVAVTYDGSKVIIYKNGVAVYESTQTGYVHNNAYSVTIGSQAFYLRDLWGILDEVRIWNVARSPEEVLNNMNRPLSGNESGLVGYWKFDETSGTIAHDSSPDGNDGTLIGNAHFVQSSAPVEDNPPIANFDWSPKPQNEGSPVDFSDASSDEDGMVVSWSWDFDSSNGVSEDSTEQNPSHTYIDNGDYPVTLIVVNQDGESNAVTKHVLVDNIAPQITDLEDRGINECDPTEDVAASFVDAGILDTHTATIDWGDGTTPEAASVTEANGSGIVTRSHTYADSGVYVVKVEVSDNDGDSHSESYQLTVANEPPVLADLEDRYISKNDTLEISAPFADCGTSDIHTATVDWGDGGAPEPATVTESNGSGSATGSHVYASGGTYTVTVAVADDDGGEDTESSTVEVQDLYVTILAPEENELIDNTVGGFNGEDPFCTIYEFEYDTNVEEEKGDVLLLFSGDDGATWAPFGFATSSGLAKPIRKITRDESKIGLYVEDVSVVRNSDDTYYAGKEYLIKAILTTDNGCVLESELVGGVAFGFHCNWRFKESTNFVLHYVVEGDKGRSKKGIEPIPEDEVDYILDIWANAFETAWEQECNELGYGDPHLPFGPSKYPVYIGLKSKKPGDTNLPCEFKGDCHTDDSDRYYWSYIRVPTTPPYASNSGEKALAAHELFHAIQLRYYVNPGAWWGEASARWMEDIVFPDLTIDYRFPQIDSSINKKWLDYPELPLNSNNAFPKDAEASKLHMYGSSIFLKYLTEIETGSSDLIGNIYTRILVSDDHNVMDAIEAELGGKSEFERVFRDFAVENYLQENYGDSILYKNVEFEEESSLEKKSVTASYRLPRLASMYFKFTDWKQLHIEVDIPFDKDQKIAGGATVIIGSDIDDIPIADNGHGIYNSPVYPDGGSATLVLYNWAKTGGKKDFPGGFKFSASNVEDGGDVVETPTAPAKPTEFALHQNIPNPFNPDTWIPYQLAEDVRVTIRVYDASGRIVRMLDLGHRSAGFYVSKEKAAYWDGRNEAGERVSSGIYFYTIQAGEFTATRKMVISQ